MICRATPGNVGINIRLMIVLNCSIEDLDF